MPISDLSVEPCALPKGTVGRNRALQAFEKRTLPFINNVIKEIVEEGILSEVDSSEMLSEPLLTLQKNIEALPSSGNTDIRKNLTQRLRFLVLVINNRLSEIPTKKARNETEQLLRKISREIGVVPMLNNHVPQPDAEFRPPEYEASANEWKRIPWESPSRTSEEEKVQFYRRKKIDAVTKKEHIFASTRLHLFAKDKNIAESEKNEALSYADGDFHSFGTVHADHLQPCADILYRQLELIDAMNIDPLLTEKLQMHEAGYFRVEGEGYFIKDRGRIYGTKKFFMDYYNCIDNLWLIVADANTGIGKGMQEPIQWLMQHESYGQEFFDNVGQGEVCKDTILYTIGDGVMLCEAAKIWFRKTQAQQISANHFVLHEIERPAKELAVKAVSQSSKRKNIEVVARFVFSGALLQLSPEKKPSTKIDIIEFPPTTPPKKPKIHHIDKEEKSPDSDSCSDIATPDAQINKETIERMKGVAKRSLHLQVAKRAAKELTGAYIAELRANKTQKTESESAAATL